MTNSADRLMTRRAFLGLSATAGCACALGGPLLGGLGQCAMRAPASYYVAHKDELLEAFRQTNEGARQYLTARHDSQLAQEVTEEAADIFERLLPDLPDVGGERNADTVFIPMAAWYVALYRPMKARGLTAEDTGRMFYELYKQDLEQMPKAEALAKGAKRFTPQAFAEMKQWADWTRKREYPANWVARFLPGDGKAFDFGYNYTECGACKYFRAQGAMDVAPYFCLTDFLRSRTFGTGLARTKTIAQGGDLCDFRYKKGRPVTQDWSTEAPRIKARMKRADS